MALPPGDFAPEQVLPLWQNLGPIIGLGKAAGSLCLSAKALTIAVKPLEAAHRIVDINEGTTKAQRVRREVLHSDGFSVPLEQFAAGRIVRGQWHHAAGGGLQRG